MCSRKELYHDPASGKIVFFPHGMDQMFWEPTGPMQPVELVCELRAAKGEAWFDLQSLRLIRKSE